MASFSMHLAIAKLYLKDHPEENEAEFIEGTLAPDLINDKSVSHYGKHSAWANPKKYLQANGNNVENSYNRAYFLHLVTDYLFYHKLVNIDEYVDKLGKDEWIKRQRNDFAILEEEIVQKYQIQDWVNNIPKVLKEQIRKMDGELTVFKRDTLFKFFEDISQIDIDIMAKELLKETETDLIKLYEKCSLNQNKGNLR